MAYFENKCDLRGQSTDYSMYSCYWLQNHPPSFKNSCLANDKFWY